MVIWDGFYGILHDFGSQNCSNISANSSQPFYYNMSTPCLSATCFSPTSDGTDVFPFQLMQLSAHDGSHLTQTSLSNTHVSL